MIPIHCAHKAVVDPSTLVPHPANPNEHGPDQVALFVQILNFQGWRRPITVSTRSGFITKGHGALAAAFAAGFTEVPIDYQDYENEAQELSDIVADNQLARMSQMNVGKLQQIVTTLETIGEGTNLEMTGFKLESLNTFLNPPVLSTEPEEEDDSEGVEYTRKVVSPIYTPKGEKPEYSEMYDTTKYAQLTAAINKAEISENDKNLLRFAACRHIVFNYEKLAEFYAHAPKEVQLLMEDSAMVIIDFNKAIEKGFVVLADEIAEAYRNA